MKSTLSRCEWCTSDPGYMKYHDEEWGVPVHDDHKLFEMITLEGAQAGLSWLTILKRRAGYRKAFHDFDPEKVVKFDDKKVNELMNDTGIIRNKLKINSTISNAYAFISIQKEYGSFDSYIWSFTNGNTIINKWKSLKEIPASTSLSDKISKDLKQRGFKFMGTTICYAFIQAVGIVNDHTRKCFRYQREK